MTNLIIVQECSWTVDIEPIKNNQNRLERPRETAVEVRHCRHILHTFVTNPCKMWRQWRTPTAISLGRSGRFCSSLMGPISTVWEHSRAIIRFVIDQCHLARMLLEATPRPFVATKASKWRLYRRCRSNVKQLLAWNSRAIFSFRVLFFLHDIEKVASYLFLYKLRNSEVLSPASLRVTALKKKREL